MLVNIDSDVKSSLVGVRSHVSKRNKSKRVPDLIYASNQFMAQKSQILADIKKEAEENILKEKVLSLIKLPDSAEEPNDLLTNPGKVVRRLPPQQCVILKPVTRKGVSSSENESGKRIAGDELSKEEPLPPIIIPGNPDKSIKMLQNQKGRDLIEKEIEKHYEQRVPLEHDLMSKPDDITPECAKESTSAIILTSLSNFDEAEEHGIDKEVLKFQTLCLDIHLEYYYFLIAICIVGLHCHNYNFRRLNRKQANWI